MDLDLMINSLPKLLSATLTTLKLLSLSLIFGLIIGLIFAIMRLSKNKFIVIFLMAFLIHLEGHRFWFRYLLFILVLDK